MADNMKSLIGYILNQQFALQLEIPEKKNEDIRRLENRAIWDQEQLYI